MMPAADTLALRSLSPVLGVEVDGHALRDTSDVAVEAVWRAIDEHALLVAHDQQLSPRELIELTRRFGEPERFPESRAVKDMPEVCIVTNDPRQAPAQPIYWHTDGAQQPEPPSLSLFYAVKAPRRDGETLFADARTAYDALPDELRERIESRRTVLPSGLEQPLVRLHPRTGRRALYADFGRTVGITGLNRADARDLLRALRAHVARAEAVYAHQWRPGDLALWDNASLLHSATKARQTAELRLMWRTTVRGGAVLPA